VKSQEQERDMYKQELVRIEQEMMMSGAKGEKALIEELEKLQKEEEKLDDELK
jgi:hypothetical protein